MVRKWQMADAPSIARYADNKKIWINLRDAFPHPYSIRDAETFISRAMDGNKITSFAIATGSEAIGSIGLIPGSDVHRYTAEMGYWLAEPFWGKGIMTRAVKIVADYAVRDMKLVRVFAEPFATNPASARVLEKAGFRREGTLRSNVVKEDRILDQYLYGFIGYAAVEEIPTEQFGTILNTLRQSGWKQTYEYDGPDAWIDYGKVIIQKGGTSLTFEWDNWIEGRIEGPLEAIEKLAAENNLKISGE